ncbi:MAG: aldo/keto reductase [Spirochaetaceae bacterium]|nr:aldo/keto reductase [Spirochaetaceae bacterium]
MIPTRPFGSTGHHSTLTLLGGAAFKPTSTEADAERVLELLFRHGVNHIDTAHGYGGGNSETLIGGWMERHRDRFFLATKTGDRTAAGARAQVELSRRRLRTDTIDLIQLHSLTVEEDWATALGPGGALEALVEERENGRVRFIGVTGHGFAAPRMHLRSLERFPFDSVLLPMNFVMASDDRYRADFDALKTVCDDRGVAVQLIKSTARRPWGGRERSRGPWYEPLEAPEDIARAVAYALSYAPAFINAMADLDLLPLLLQAAELPGERPSDAEMKAMVNAREMQPIFEDLAMIH